MEARANAGLSERDHRRVAEFIERTSGVQLPAKKRYLIEGRLRKRQARLRFNSLASYLDFVLEDPEGRNEQISLIDSLTTNKTDFFREPQHFDFILERLLPCLARSQTAGFRYPLRVWSAGCSTGEEPYTLAMILDDAKEKYPGFRFEILATDIAPSVLRTAVRAVYPHERVEPVPMDLRRKYLLRGSEGARSVVKIDKRLRSQIAFRAMNLLRDPFDFDHRFDLIFCRNVMIYFSSADRDRLIGKYESALAANGHLFVGHAERIHSHDLSLKMVVPTVYRK